MGFRADLIIEDQVMVEIKSVDAVAPVHKKQLLTYLKLADKRLGLLINFNVALIKDGITRIVNGLQVTGCGTKPNFGRFASVLTPEEFPWSRGASRRISTRHARVRAPPS